MASVENSAHTLRYPDPISLSEQLRRTTLDDREDQAQASDQASAMDTVAQETGEDHYLSTPPASMLASASGRSPYASPDSKDQSPRSRVQALAGVMADDWENLSAPSELYPKAPSPAPKAEPADVDKTVDGDPTASSDREAGITSAVEDSLLERSFEPAHLPPPPRPTLRPRLSPEPSYEESEERRKSWIAGVEAAEKQGRLLHPATGSGGMASGPIQAFRFAKRHVGEEAFETDSELGPDDSLSQAPTNLSNRVGPQLSTEPQPTPSADLAEPPREEREVSPVTVRPAGPISQAVVHPAARRLGKEESQASIDESDDLSSAYLSETPSRPAPATLPQSAPPTFPTLSVPELPSLPTKSAGRQTQSDLGVGRPTEAPQRQSSTPVAKRTPFSTRASTARDARNARRGTVPVTDRRAKRYRGEGRRCTPVFVVSLVAIVVALALWATRRSVPTQTLQDLRPEPVPPPEIEIQPVPRRPFPEPVQSPQETIKIVEHERRISKKAEVPVRPVEEPLAASPPSLIRQLPTSSPKPVASSPKFNLVSIPAKLGPFDKHFLPPPAAEGTDWLWVVAQGLLVAGLLCAAYAAGRSISPPSSPVEPQTPQTSDPSRVTPSADSPIGLSGPSDVRRRKSIVFSGDASADHDAERIYKREPSTPPPRRVSFALEDYDRPIFPAEVDASDAASEVTVTPRRVSQPTADSAAANSSAGRNRTPSSAQKTPNKSRTPSGAVAKVKETEGDGTPVRRSPRLKANSEKDNGK